MSDDLLRKQATEVTSALSGIIRRINALDADDPTMDLPIAQLRVCGLLREGRMSMSEIGRELGISMSAVTQLADRLERAGLVERVPEPHDRRVRCLELTSHGAEIMAQRKEKRLARAMEALDLIPEEGRSEVIRSLRILLGAARAVSAADTDALPSADPLMSGSS